MNKRNKRKDKRNRREDRREDRREKIKTHLGTITEALPNTSFRVRLDNEQEIVVYLSGKMRLYRIKVLVGDKVELILDSQESKGRIIRRL